MTTVNQILQFAGGGSANVLTPAEYAALTSIVENGFPSGILLSTNLNVVLRQCAFVASMIGQFIANNSGNSALDDGNLTELLNNFILGLNNNLSATQSLATNGYQQLPGGMIVQWGTASTTTGNGDVITFPLAFPNHCFNVIVNEGNGAGWAGTPPQPTIFASSTKTKTTFELYAVRIVTGTPAYEGGLTAAWMAIGN